MEDDDNMLILFLHMVSLTARWDTDPASEAGINLCAKLAETLHEFTDVSVAVHLFDSKITPLDIK